MAVERELPYSGFNFLVEIDGVAELRFGEVTGLGAEIAVLEYRSGRDRTNTPHKVPGLTSYPPVTFHRGVTGDLGLWEWFDRTSSGEPDRRAVSISLLNETREEVLRWTLSNAWPSRWEGPSLKATVNEIAIETLELTHETGSSSNERGRLMEPADVVLDVELVEGGFYLVLVNIGGSVARDVRVRFKPELVGVDGEVISALPVWSRLATLRPQREIRVLYDTAASVFSKKRIEQRFATTVSWKEVDRSPKPQSYDHDLGAFRGLPDLR